jgi:endonuclease G
MPVDKTSQVVGFMEWIAPSGSLEAAVESPHARTVEKPPWGTDEEVERATEAVHRLERGEPLDAPHADALEAIILPQERPVVDVLNGSYARPAAPFEHLGDPEARATIEAAIGSIGRIELPDHPSLPYGGTGFVVGDGLLMTNRHVAELFAAGVGREELSFRPERRAEIDFLRERDRDETKLFQIVRVVMVHPYWDMALLATEGLEAVAPLRLAVAAAADLFEQEVAVIGYPALDPRNNVELQNRIFRSLFNVKRMQPGRLRDRADIRSFEHNVSAVTHDSSTLGGNSGSAVVDVRTGMVVALHFAGIYLKANYAVPTLELARDRRVVEAGVNFDSEVPDAGPLPSDRYWEEADPPRRPSRAPESPTTSAAQPAELQALSWTIPVELTVTISSRRPAPAEGGSAAATAAGIEAAVEPFRDEDYSGRHGYDERFLGMPVPMPRVLDTGAVSHLDDGSHALPYEHFSIVQHKDRRLALLTVANVDARPASKRPEAGRDYTRKGLTGLGENDQERWFTDPRIPAAHQLPDRFFTLDRASFDKGHIVRREDVAWGRDYDELRRANGDTFHVTNCSPQVARFNRSNLKGVWGQLENLVLAQARSELYCVLAGPVLRSDDPVFRGVDDDGTVRVQIPRRFWKIVVARSGDELQSFAFVLDQDLSDTDLEFAVDELWRTRMISLPDLGRLVDLLEFPAELLGSDQIDAPAGEAVQAHPGIETYSA